MKHGLILSGLVCLVVLVEYFVLSGCGCSRGMS